MDLEFLIRGVVIGFSIAAPVGPIGVLTINRTISQGNLQGFATGLGAALADSFYGVIAAFGLSAISTFLMQQEAVFRVVGGVFLIYLGIKAFRSEPDYTPDGQSGGHTSNVINNLVSTFFLTVTNPATILAFLAIFAGVGLGTQQGDYASSATLVLGVFLGSAFWWLLLSSVVGYFRSHIREGHLIWINRISGVTIAAFGLIALSSVVPSN